MNHTGHTHWSIRAGCAVMALTILTACGDYAYRWKKYNYSPNNKPKERVLGVLTIDDTIADNDIELHLTKKRGGYGIETPIYQSEFGNVNAVVSKSKDYHYFTGFQYRFEF